MESGKGSQDGDGTGRQVADRDSVYELSWGEPTQSLQLLLKYRYKNKTAAEKDATDLKKHPRNRRQGYALCRYPGSRQQGKPC